MDYNKIVKYVYEAREIIFSKNLNIQIKNDNPNDFVTNVDIGISNFLKEKLHKEFPMVGFVTEEESSHTFLNRSFILDPIDGTTNLISGYHMCSISLAYQEDNDVKFGVVFNPFTNEMFFSIKGLGAYLYNTDKGIDALLKKGVENYNKNKLKVSDRDFSKSIIEFGTNVANKKSAKQTFNCARRIFEHCLDLRRICSTAIAICYIAAGRIDGYFEKVIKPWDFAAGMLILTEAGGKSSTWEGKNLPLDKPCSIISSNTKNYDSLKKYVSK